MKGHLANQFMSCLGDRTEMAHSIGGRTPFLDHHVAEYFNNTPPSLKVKWNGNEGSTAKYALREAVKSFVTQEVYERVKHVSQIHLMQETLNCEVTMHCSLTEHPSHTRLTSHFTSSSAS